MVQKDLRSRVVVIKRKFHGAQAINRNQLAGQARLQGGDRTGENRGRRGNPFDLGGEAWGRDAFTLLTLLAEHTSKVQLATSIVNIYSRTPAALAQHFGTLDELSNGRMIIGLGTSGPQVIEHFHGIPFNPPLTRMKEYVEIINMIMAQTPLNYDGKLFKLQRGFTMRFETPRKHIPIWIASLNKKSVEFTAKKADGWLPVMIPINSLKKAIADFRAIATAAGREPRAVAVKAPGHVTVTANVDRAVAGHAANVAFYAARMGTFYSEQLTRFGFGDDVQKVKQAWDTGGSRRAPRRYRPSCAGRVGLYRRSRRGDQRLKAQEEAGVDLHPVDIDAGGKPGEEAREDRRAVARMIVQTGFADSAAQALYRGSMSRRNQAALRSGVHQKRRLVIRGNRRSGGRVDPLVFEGAIQ